MKKIFIFFFALIFVNLSCLKLKTTTVITKKYIINQTQHDVSLNFFYAEGNTLNTTINLLKNTSDSFEYIETSTTGGFEYQRPFTKLNYKNKEFNFRNLKINFNNKKIELNLFERYKDSFIRIPSKNSHDTLEFFNSRLYEFFETHTFNELYLLPRLYDSAK